VTTALDRFYHHLSRPLVLRSRWLLGFLVVPLALSFSAPLWNIHLVAPQYPQGLNIDIYAYTVEGDIQEVNTLNHYIGMSRIDRASLTDLDWIPFALGVLIVLTLRVASIGENRSLVDLTVLFLYFSLFSLARFYLKMYVFGHNLNPEAPFKVEPFMPAVLGSRQIANFTTSAWPRLGSLWVGIYGTGLLALLLWNLRGALAPAAARSEHPAAR
jgi:hypothetical protein